ncbi:MAG: transcriptional regulator of acetoin/glycerol metabolism [Bacteriovoracaceae bacterium]|jgi:transcriptional regulator of acetoin/glycerol metabolism
METTECRYISDFGSLRLNRSGLRLGDKLAISPFNGPKQEVTLTRLSYRLRRGESFKYSGEKSEILIPFVSKLFTEYQLRLCSKDSETSIDESGRYLLKSIGINPFKLNGNYTFEAFLEYGDIVELEYTRLEIKKKHSGKEALTLPLSKRIIESELSILIEGETGTGKSRLARNLHESSLKNGPFVHINISSYASTLIESELFGHIKGAFTGAVNNKMGAFAEANRGTLFIDEIDSLPLGIQTKLLLFLDNKKIRPVGAERDQQLDVRLIFSSGKELKNLVKEGKMRSDFYYRLSTGGRVRMPSLRKNKKLITQLLKEFEIDEGLYITPQLKEFYRSYGWPGNIRQLLGHLKQKQVLSGGEKIDHCSLDEELSLNIIEEEVLEMDSEVRKLEEVKNMYVMKIYNRFGNNIKRSAKLLGVSPNTVRSVVRLSA